MRSKPFWISFVVALCVISAVSLAVGLLVYPAGRTPAAGSVSRADDGDYYLPTAGDNFSLLAIGSDEVSGKLSGVSMIRFDVANGKVPVVTLPTAMLVPYKTGSATLEAIYAEVGVTALMKALAQYFSVSLNRYIDVTRDGFIKSINIAGSVKSAAAAGGQTLDGARLYDVMQKAAYPGGEKERLYTVSQTVADIINQKASLFLLSNGPDVLSAILANTKTDISAGDIEDAYGALRFMAKLSAKPAYAAEIGGSIGAEGSFVMGDATKKMITQAFS